MTQDLFLVTRKEDTDDPDFPFDAFCAYDIKAKRITPEMLLKAICEVARRKAPGAIVTQANIMLLNGKELLGLNGDAQTAWVTIGLTDIEKALEEMR